MFFVVFPGDPKSKDVRILHVLWLFLPKKISSLSFFFRGARPRPCLGLGRFVRPQERGGRQRQYQVVGGIGAERHPGAILREAETRGRHIYIYIYALYNMYLYIYIYVTIYIHVCM